MELIQMLMSQLGVSEEQAKGGSGLLLKMAKDKLDSGAFGQVASAIPGAEDLISAAPEAGGTAGGIGGMLSSFGGGAAKLGGMAGLAGGFKNLNLGSDMVGKFIPVVISFVRAKGGDGVGKILEGVLK